MNHASLLYQISQAEDDEDLRNTYTTAKGHLDSFYYEALKGHTSIGVRKITPQEAALMKSMGFVLVQIGDVVVVSWAKNPNASNNITVGYAPVTQPPPKQVDSAYPAVTYL
jgi:hypothetical protein